MLFFNNRVKKYSHSHPNKIKLFNPIYLEWKVLNLVIEGQYAWAYEQTFFPSAQKIFPFSNPNPFPFEPKETKIREDNF